MGGAGSSIWPSGQVLRDEAIIELAASRADPGLRALDATHVASALSLGDDLGAMVTFDRRQRAAAAAAGLAVQPEKPRRR
jgi:predicted nucleic acid-binding protein